MRVQLPGAEDDAGKVAVVDGVRVGLGFQAESAMALIDCAPLAHEAAVPRHEVVCVELDPRLVGEDLQHAAALLVLDRSRHPDPDAVHAKVVVKAVVRGLLDCFSQVDPLSGKGSRQFGSSVGVSRSLGNVFTVPVTQVV